jgi:hypothetical protein
LKLPTECRFWRFGIPAAEVGLQSEQLFAARFLAEGDRFRTMLSS